MTKLYIFFLLIGIALSTNSQTIERVKKINPTASSEVQGLLKMEDVVYFQADDGTAGAELWKTDGTAAGTVLVADIIPGPAGSKPWPNLDLDGTLLFTTSNDEVQLWKSDGTTAGTVLIKNLPVIESGGGTGDYRNINGIAYFTNYAGSENRQVWKSDGTSDSTVMLKSMNTGFGPGDYTEAGGTIFFVGTDDTHGVELWKTDGTETGTVMIKDIYPTWHSYPDYLTAYKGKLYFAATDRDHRDELWMSDGTEDGTVLVKDLAPGTYKGEPEHLTVIRDTLYFGARTPDGGAGIWKSDGTTEGTVMIKQTSVEEKTRPRNFTYFNGMIYFSAYADGLGRELWKTDGSEGGTVLVKDIFPGSGSSNPYGLTVFNGVLYFGATDDANEPVLWKSDGTEAGTVKVPASPEIGEAWGPGYVTTLDNNLLFKARDANGHWELFRITGGSVPLNLLDFYAKPDGRKVQLQWETTNEVNTLTYEVQRAAEHEFTAIGKIAATNRTGRHHYQFQDHKPLSGTNLYRLKMIDIDGSSTYSPVKRVDVEVAEALRLYPNPAREILQLQNLHGYDQLQIVDASGRIVHQEKIIAERQNVNLKKLLRGDYILRVTGSDLQKSVRFVKQ